MEKDIKKIIRKQNFSSVLNFDSSINQHKRAQKNKSINRISKELGRSYKHVMKVAHMIMERVKTRKFLEKLSGVVEMDEMYTPAGQKGSRCASRRPRKRGLKLRGRGTWEQGQATHHGSPRARR